MSRAKRLLLLEIVSPIAIVAALWVWSARAGSFFFPPLSSIYKAFNTVWLGPGLLNDAVPSLSRWATAYAIAVILGSPSAFRSASARSPSDSWVR